MDGYRDKGSRASDVVFEDQVYLSSQSGTIRLDKFTHCLLVKCSVEVSYVVCAVMVYLHWLSPDRDLDRGWG